MAFTQIEFLIFFCFLLLALFFINSNNAKKYMLWIANCYFYLFFDLRFLILLLFMTISTYSIGKTLEKSIVQNHRKLVLWAGVLINLGVLFYFKYYNFFIESMSCLFSIDTGSVVSSSFIIPLGVSFYTFRFISHLIDVYRQRSENIAGYQFIDFLIYGTFFPIIVSGPIARAQNFLPQLSNIKISSVNLYNGFRLFVIGLFLKIFVADKIAPFINFYYENYQVFDASTTWLAILSYDIQIYCDFAGYSSMAIGLSLMIGFQIEENFNFPYTSVNISEFWKRWHITLSEWIRDYLYIPLGGNRKGKIIKYINLIVAMSLCGLWHGSAWTFVLWGFLHGITLVVNHHWKEDRSPFRAPHVNTLYRFMSWLLTFITVTFCWIIFRSENVSQAIDIMRKTIDFNSTLFAWYQPFVVFILFCFLLFHIIYFLQPKIISWSVESRVTSFILFCLIWLVIVFYPTEFQPFVYSQF